MNCFKFLYDVLVWLTQHYSELPEGFKKSFPEARCVDARLFLSELAQSGSDLNQNFVDYE